MVLKSVVNLSLTECQNTTVLFIVLFKYNFSSTKVKRALFLYINSSFTQVISTYNFSKRVNEKVKFYLS